MYGTYTDDGGHLNETGRVRVATAFWNLMAQLGGWSPSGVTDTDGDGLTDDFETANGLNLNAADSDGDGLDDAFEVGYDGNVDAYDPYDPDTNPSGTDLDANDVDTDGDGQPDNVELAWGYGPLDPASTPTLPLAAGPAILALLAAGGWTLHRRGR